MWYNRLIAVLYPTRARSHASPRRNAEMQTHSLAHTPHGYYLSRVNIAITGTNNTGTLSRYIHPSGGVLKSVRV